LVEIGLFNPCFSSVYFQKILFDFGKNIMSSCNDSSCDHTGHDHDHAGKAFPQFNLDDTTAKVESGIEKPTLDLPEISVNGVVISEKAIGNEVQHHPAGSVDSAVREAVEALVIKELLLQKAKAEGLADNLTDASTEQEQEVVIGNLLDKEVTTPESDSEACLVYYNANKEKFRSADLVEASHILLAASPDDANERHDKKTKALTLIAALKDNPGAFGEYALKYSSCPSKDTGGSLGQLTKGSTVEEFERQVFKMPEGLCEHPIESRYGYHVVWVNRHVAGEQLPFDLVENKVENYMAQQVYRQAIGQYMQILIAEADIKGIDMGGEGTLVR